MINNNDNKYHNLLNNLPEIIFELDKDGFIHYINDKVTEIFGYNRDELIGKNPLMIIAEEEHGRVGPIIKRIKNGERYVRGELIVVTKEGKRFPANISINPTLHNGELVGISGILIDISKEKSIEDQFLRSEDRYKRLSDMALEGIVIFDEGKIIDANQAFAAMFGYEIEELIDMDLKKIISPIGSESIGGIDGGKDSLPIEVKAVRKNSDTFEIEFITRAFVHNDKTIFTAVVQDISYKKRIEFIEEHDELTNLLNRRGFIKRLRQEIESANTIGSKVAIMNIRLEHDELSVIKDMQPELENLLMNLIPLETAERLTNTLFESDCIARIDKNEYLTLHPLPGDHDVKNTVTLINKVLGLFNTPFLEGVRMIPHFGVTFYPDDTRELNPMHLIRNCGYACEEAIKNNRDYVFYDEKSHHEMRERIEFVKDLILAVKEDSCKSFNLFYQPKVNQDGRIVGMEALIRWGHPRWSCEESSYVLPDKFIGTAEDIGLIGDIGNWVLMEACRQTKKWHDVDDRFKHLQVAVNVSPSQLNIEFENYVEKVLNETGLNPEYLELEITEREMMKKKNLEILFRIKSRGISLAIDDFGIDYSSLSKLPKLSIDTIKLDKSYIANVASDIDYENLVYHTIQMVHGFNLIVVAEGVENADQVKKLFVEMNCDKIQGYYYYKPMAPHDFLTILHENLEE